MSDAPETVKIDNTPPPGQSYDKYKKAFEMISLDDVNRIENVPCMRNALLYGIGGGMAFGAIHFISTRRIKSSWNWTFASAMVVMVGTWQHCRSRRTEEMDKMRQITEKYSDHHISNLKRRNDEARRQFKERKEQEERVQYSWYNPKRYFS
ncbi:hypothetical protein E3Q22_03101 [Wallemia mellicola]|uniref:Cytochrome c oxidase assembly protein COX20, mitochondrial n=1 Tax=Wallemia mellicola TaxID=1708541 RepID=A0A4T0LV59_9BASI|nr:hypothetical protein E3Q23_02820 [Wallemia mellicola]TIB77374.1 hypothetical protein E3Q22_03101 [Wallemia mellicola]TIC03417.1 hypothetical protein E3Q16_03025 [Wallemia mellicola]TIC26980.1 hypothetical protein E3Q11_02876 [Wallemia mellicola]TIC53045.1 hypothetical protein E3Q05_02551 [Wallemia mellicola]